MASKKQEGLLIEGDWSRGVLTDLPRTAMPEGTIAAASDFLLHRQGVAEKRGGTSYFGPVLTATVPGLIDSSDTAHEITAHGDAHIDTSTFTLGDGSVGLDGTGDYLTLDGDTDFSMGTSDFTVDLRLRLTSLPSTVGRVYDCRPSAAAIAAKNKITEQFSTGNTYTTDATLSPQANTLYLCSVTLPADLTVSSVAGCGLTWVQVKAKKQGSGTNTLYTTVFRAMKGSGLTDGKVTVTLSGSVVDNSYVVIDEFTGVNTSGTDGSGAIVQSKSNGDTANNLTVTLDPFSGTANIAFGLIGVKNNNLPLTANGFTALGSKRGTSASPYSVITMYKTADDDPKATFSTQSLCAGIAIELAAAYYPLISVTSGGKVTYSPATPSSATATLTSTTTLSTSTWYHLAVVRSSNVTKLYINGTSEASVADANSYSLGGSRPAIGGSGATEGTECIAGNIDELRVSNTARWTTTFTPSASAYSSDVNTMLLMHGDNVLLAAQALRSVVYADFPTGGMVLVTADNNHLYRMTSDAATDLGSVNQVRVSPLCKPAVHVSGTTRVIFPASDGVSGPFSYNGTTLASLAGTAPAGRIAGIFKARLLLANSSANPNRMWFGPLDPSTTWDTANAWVDFDHPITGLAPVRNTLLVFSSGHCDYVTGSVPPGTQGFDMAQGPLGDVGCSDARSIDAWQDSLIFANLEGVYMTNGAAFRSLTEPPEYGNSGIGTHWRSLLADYTSSWQIHGGVLGDFYIVTVRDSSDTLLETWMCYLPRRSWWQVDNFDAGMYASRSSFSPELYYAARNTARVVTTSGIFTPTAATKNDADGTAVEPALTTRFLGTGPMLKAYGFARLTYDLRDAGDQPSLGVSMATGAEATTFADVTESPLPATSDAVRSRVTLNKDAQGVTLTFAQSGPSSQTELFALEVEERQYQAVVDGET